MPKSVSNTFIYKNMNKGNTITNSIVSILKGGKLLTEKDLNEPLIIINRYRFPLKTKVIEDFTSGKIRLVIPPERTKLPSYMPFFLTKDRDKIVAIIDASVYGTLLKDGNFKIDAKKLYCLLEGAHLALLYYMSENAIKQHGNILTRGSAIYSNMFIRILNKQFSINIDKNKLQKALFLSSKFFLINVIGLKDSNMVFNYAAKNVTDISMNVLEDLNDEFKIEYYKDLASFIQGLEKISDSFNLGLEGITVRGFLESYILMYDGAALLALEYFPYFIYNIISVINGGYINNQKLLEQVIGGDASSFYTALVSLDR